MTIDEIVSRLSKPKKNGNGYTALCPAHDDKSPSLSIAEGDDGKILLKCFVGCSTETIVRVIGLEMKDLFPVFWDELSRTARHNGNGSHRTPKAVTDTKTSKVIAAVYEYTDADGEVLYENVRFHPKDFRQRRPDGNGGYIYNLDGIDRVPYRLPELTDGMQEPDAEIWLTEGEKDADNLRLLGFTATSFKNWNDGLNRYIKGAHAVLFADHDTAGQKQANDAARTIAKVATSVKVIDLYHREPLPDKHGKDVSDWIEEHSPEGNIAERLANIVKHAELWQPDVADITHTANRNERFKFSFTTLSELYREPEEETSYVWDRTFPIGGFSIISAKPKVGKSTVLRNLAVAISSGEPFLGRDTLKGKVLYLCLEEKRNEVRKHFELMHADGDSILIHTGKAGQSTEETLEA